MKITYHSHSVLSIVMANGQKLLFDPFITGNALTDLKAEEVTADWILVTHGHSDHIGDLIPIAKRNDATVISIVEICSFAEQNGVQKTHGMNIGGKFDFPFGRVKMVPAQHSSGYEVDGQMIYMGEPAGFILQAEGKTLYHAGDTAEFGDMALLGETFEIDLAFLPIGDNFTMGPQDAASAAKRLKAKQVVPIHYNTFPVIEQDPDAFVQLLPEKVGKVMAVGETIEI
ncbi:metal-dependent hydrolase [Enterococcus pseudoavium]|uniref:metal-dependent hydrolase n=1 Tax=Enterococcus pseudoavium TaxID=44007 RepID=UPI0008348498|nr:metal-dependent hydrolase [Enterococcus pseudoavium]MDT2753483.1 metal-dependent hydrolase [Enterococcus pseudoavium]REC32351.1 metal-dependent hydrolase [Enterococcus pseudoavium]